MNCNDCYFGLNNMNVSCDVHISARTPALFTAAGPIDFRHAFLDMTNIVVKESPHTRAGRTCPAAMGFSFAAGTTDGESIDHCFLRQQSGLVFGTKTSLHAGVLENVFSAEQCAGEPARLESCVCIFMSLCSSCFSSFCFTSSCFLTCVHPLLHVKLDRLKFVKSTT